ncbi:hypothetical protein QJS04_geneDACA005359 [Acorus gramineus]|uniref:Uncharacterized protein n=1 Tax=Acorus gramineus TaxID=55184 RepID=A0AAV9AYG8_ACOGR|nr:hypothetical protein QJS04_geneDACA005359 [Acorus gramineus]
MRPLFTKFLFELKINGGDIKKQIKRFGLTCIERLPSLDLSIWTVLLLPLPLRLRLLLRLQLLHPLRTRILPPPTPPPPSSPPPTPTPTPTPQPSTLRLPDPPQPLRIRHPLRPRRPLLHRPIHLPSRSLAVDQPIVRRKPISAPSSRRTCMCSPTNHPGSFRCSLHKGFGPSPAASGGRGYSSSSSQLSQARRSAMTNSLVRIGTVEGDWVKRALAALIRPSSHQQRRRAAFQPRPTRLSVVSTAVDCES